MSIDQEELKNIETEYYGSKCLKGELPLAGRENRYFLLNIKSCLYETFQYDWYDKKMLACSQKKADYMFFCRLSALKITKTH